MFVPMLEPPSYTDPNYIMQSAGGKNPCIRGWNAVGNSVLANCCGFVIGRMLSLYGNDAYSLPWQYNAGEYFPNLNENGVWKRSSKPTLGSIGCYLSTVGSWGHVLVVEQVNADGSIVTSESAWQGKRWYSQVLRPPLYTWNNSFKLQGFIYNVKGPTTSSSKVEALIAKAKSYVGKKASSLGITVKACSAEFLIYCAKEVPDLVGTVIPDRKDAETFASLGVRKGMGTFIKGPLYGQKVTPKPGDIVLERKIDKKVYSGEMSADKLYLVTDTKEDSFSVVGVDNDAKIIKGEYKTYSKLICGYYRPKWSLVDTSTDYMVGYAPLGKFYDTENTSEDATVREVAYLNNSNKPTIDKSSVKLSVVNYTTLLDSVLSNLLVPSAYSGNLNGEVLVDGVSNQKARECIQFLIGKGLNAAATCGICGNIEAESVPPYNTASKGDYQNGTYWSFGICQWYRGRGEAMRRFVGDGWENNLTGQLEYLWSELQSAYNTSVLIPLQSVPNTEQGARKAADIFVRNFEIPANIDEQSLKRQDNASRLYNQLVIQMSTTSTSSSAVNPNNTMLKGRTVDIPTYISQDGISAIYTNYSYWYSRWDKSSMQYKLSRIWSQKGSKSNRNIATIDGMYLIAVKPIFGTTGDKVSVVLKDGTVINCIIADVKANDDGVNTYGHNASGGRINIIEFEATSNPNSKYIQQPMDLSGWQGKWVSKIVNGGSIL